jgi:hypothetical protein
VEGGEVQGTVIRTYVTGDRFIRFQPHARTSPGRSARESCPTCACHTHWDAGPEALAGEVPGGVRDALTTRMGINARLLDGFEVREGANGAVPFLQAAELEVRFFANAAD